MSFFLVFSPTYFLPRMLTLRALAALLVVAWAPQCGAASLVVGGSAPLAPTTPRTTPRLAACGMRICLGTILASQGELAVAG